ncbi:IDEAL domain-containing protein [Priestia sp. FSL W8-0524]|uniref:IDEAL domain-containing protein n=1 Tax=Priestia sp. FSL W8-0524 TaxID=2954625 RepID=UPI0030FCD16A
MTLQDLKPGELLELRIVGLHVICKFLSYCKRPRHIHVEAVRVVIGEVVEGSEACIPLTKYMSRYEPPSNDQTDLCSTEHEEVDKLILALEKQLFDYHINKALDNGDKDKFLELVRGMNGEMSKLRSINE